MPVFVKRTSMVIVVAPDVLPTTCATSRGVPVVTVTVNDVDTELPAASVAVHVTGVTPTANTLPDAGEQVTGNAPSVLSVADVANVTVAPPGCVAGAVMSAMLSMVGGVTSGKRRNATGMSWSDARSGRDESVSSAPSGKSALPRAIA